MRKSPICKICGEPLPESGPGCPLCEGQWECWELRFSALPLEGAQKQITDWVSALPTPAALAITAGQDGLRVRLYVRGGMGSAGAAAWAALTRQHSHWGRVDDPLRIRTTLFALSSPALLPVFSASTGDPFLALGVSLGSLAARGKNPASLYFWLLGRDARLQTQLQALYAYATGTEKGVEDDTPNPWSLRLGLWRGVMAAGGLLAAGGGAAVLPGWIPSAAGALAVLSGATLLVSGFWGTQRWMRLRSLPKQVVEPRLEGALMKVAVILDAGTAEGLNLLSGVQRWRPVRRFWPDARRYAFPLPGADIARLVSPLETGQGAGMLARDAIQDVPAPPPSAALRTAPDRIGRAVAGGDGVGIGRDGHVLVVGGSRTGKSSAVFRLLLSRLEDPEESPGLFLVDPHGSLADALLHSVDRLPALRRAQAIARLRIITPAMDALVPLNPLTLEDFDWAGNAIVQAGQRIWADFWGPRMQAALLALARLAHAWNRQHPDAALGLAHTAFAAFNPEWRRQAMAYLPPAERTGSVALDALLGQGAGRRVTNHRWTTEVVSPILSKMMALELSPWLYAAMHQPGFVDLEGWIRDRAWIVLRLPAGEIGREGARLTAGMVYNIFEAAFRKVTAGKPAPYDFVIDETQEIAGAMQLDSLLSEGGKFGARLFVLAQSLSLLRKLEGFEPVVQSLLANTSAQLFFSPDPEDAELVRKTLSLDARYGDTTIDIPSLQAWLRARVEGSWQPPTLIRIEPLIAAEPERVRRVIQDVIDAHPEAYVSSDDWQAGFLQSLQLLAPEMTASDSDPARSENDHRRLGW